MGVGAAVTSIVSGGFTPLLASIGGAITLVAITA
jgi:hypothetical protein